MKNIVKLPISEKELASLKSVATSRDKESAWCYVHREYLLALVLEIESYRNKSLLPRGIITPDMFDDGAIEIK